MCDGTWIPRTEELLSLHCACAIEDEKPVSSDLRAAICTALKEGNEKHTNVFLHGPNTSGKSHVFKPLIAIFEDSVFLRPVGKGNFPMQTIFGKKVCVLQDCRVNTFRLGFDSLLVWWEGENFPVPVPQNKNDGEPMYKEKAPVFITAGSKFRICPEEARKLELNAREQNEMMDARFNYFHFPCSLSKKKKVKVKTCKKCFALWLVSGLSVGLPSPPASSEASCAGKSCVWV